MPDLTDNHSYEMPIEGEQDWDVPLNNTIETLEVDVEIRDTEGNRGSYTPVSGARYTATDSGRVYLGDGAEWQSVLGMARVVAGDIASLVAGHQANSVGSGIIGAVIAGGGPTDTNDAANTANAVYDDYGVVGGGGNNQAGSDNDTDDGTYATVAGGQDNSAEMFASIVGGGAGNVARKSGAAVLGGYRNVADDFSAVVGGGQDNSATGSNTVVAGGNTNEASAREATVGGGWDNTANAIHATVSGGTSNEASARGATVAGGNQSFASGEASTVGGGAGNSASGAEATVAGGDRNQAIAETSAIGGGGGNAAFAGAAYSSIAGGRGNVSNAKYASIGGGGPSNENDVANTTNTVFDDYGTVGGGANNQAGTDDFDTTDTRYATVGGGLENTAAGESATVAGGWNNTAIGDLTPTVGGGLDNTASAQAATVAGGWNNTASDSRATVGGGKDNVASGVQATVPGGEENEADGWYSLAAGLRAKANHTGSFVWADSTQEDVTSTAIDQFVVQAGGGVGVNTTDTDATLNVDGGNWDLDNSEGDFRIGTDDHKLKIGVATGGGGAGDTHIRTESTNLNKLSLGVGSDDVLTITPSAVHPASDNTYSLGKSGNRWSEVWSANGTVQTSDARLKTNVDDLDGGLDVVRALRPVSYDWKDGAMGGDDDSRLGLLAQEVAEVLPEAVVEPENGDTLGLAYDMLIPVLIDAVDEQQDTVEAQRETIETVHEANERKDRRIDDLERELQELQETVEDLADAS